MIESVVVFPNALFGIIDYAETGAEFTRDFGVLLGSITENAIIVNAAYPIYGISDSNYFSFDVHKLEQAIELHRTALEQHSFVGWYVTNPELLQQTKQLFKSSSFEENTTVMLSMDLQLTKDHSFGMKTYLRKPMGIVGEDTADAIFMDIPFKISGSSAELTALNFFTDEIASDQYYAPQSQQFSLYSDWLKETLSKLLYISEQLKECKNQSLIVQLKKTFAIITRIKESFKKRTLNNGVLYDIKSLESITSLIYAHTGFYGITLV